MSALDYLKRDIVQYIYDQGWPSLRKIQEAAIQHVHTGQNNLILSAPTASGKTEAAFLPAINSVDDWSQGVKILYISPLIALINDQFKRVTELCEYLDIPVTSWHGEASRARKQSLLKDPRGILLITPESIEAMLVHRPGQAKTLLQGVEWVIIDELHSSLDTTRGVHLQSLLGRIGMFTKQPARYVGMTATLNRESYVVAKHFFANDRETSVLLDPTRNELSSSVLYAESEGVSTPADIIDDIYQHSCNESMLVFPNSRGRVEEIAIGLKRRAKKLGSNAKYFAHHASVDKELRLEAEEFAKTAGNQLFTICCTSTLELGIDIGAVDSVAQVEGAPSVSSLAQRLGRSGRQQQHSILRMYASKDWSLLQNLATLQLYEQGTIEQIEPIKKPYTVIVQQVLSLLLQCSGLARTELITLLTRLDCWGEISESEINQVIDHLVTIDFIENVDGTLVTGLAAERLIGSKDFYAHFDAENEFKVLNNHEHIGEMPLTLATVVGENIYLAARIWKITEIDTNARKIYVLPAKDGKPPIFGGGAGDVSHLVRRQMLAYLNAYDQLAQQYERSINDALAKLAKENLCSDGSDQLIKQISDKKQSIMTFAGSKINRTLLLLLWSRTEVSTDQITLDDFDSSITGPNLQSRLVMLADNPVAKDELRQWLRKNRDIMIALSNTKYLNLLPEELRVDYLIYNHFDISAANEFIAHHRGQIANQLIAKAD